MDWVLDCWGPKNLLIPISLSLKRKSTRIRKLRMLSIAIKRGFSSILKPLKRVIRTIKRLAPKSKT